MVSMLPPHGHHMGPYFRHGKTHGAKRVGDNPGPAARGDLKEGMAEPFYLNGPQGSDRPDV